MSVHQGQLPLAGGDLARPEKPILCLDFDGVLHSYISGWRGIDCIPDPPVPGFERFLLEAVEHFHVVVYSSRSAELAGIVAMKAWLHAALLDVGLDGQSATVLVMDKIGWPAHKPAAFLTLDDRALTFTGEWPRVAALRNFRPWYQLDKAGADG